MDRRRRQITERAVMVRVVVPWEEPWPNVRASSSAPNRSGHVGRYFSVGFREWVVVRHEGPLWVFTTPRSARSKATGLLRIDALRSACRVSWPGSIPCFVQVAVIRRSAKAALSCGATIQPTTHRLKTSRIT